MASGHFITWIIEAKCIEIGLILLLIVEVFVGVERIVTLFLLADRRIRNASLAESVRNADRGKIAGILGDHSCLLSLMLRRCLASMSASELRHTLDGEFQAHESAGRGSAADLGGCALVGLLGTVLGTMVAMASNNPKLGISTALVTTALGIAVALEALVANHFSEERWRGCSTTSRISAEGGFDALEPTASHPDERVPVDGSS